MNALPSTTTVSAVAPLPLVSGDGPAPAIDSAARLLPPRLERGERIDAAALRAAMETAFGASDAAGARDWKLAYEAGEAAIVLFLRKYGRALFRAAPSPAARLILLSKISGLLPTHTRRSEEVVAFQQFSTPSPLGFVALTAAAIIPGDRVLEPSAGTGLLAILAAIADGALILNELTATRAALLFPTTPLTRFDAAQIDGLQLRRVRVMGVHRIELVGFTEPVRERLRAQGLFSKIIAWRLRFFVPADAGGVTVLARLLETYAITRVVDREAA